MMGVIIFRQTAAPTHWKVLWAVFIVIHSINQNFDLYYQWLENVAFEITWLIYNYVNIGVDFHSELVPSALPFNFETWNRVYFPLLFFLFI